EHPRPWHAAEPPSLGAQSVCSCTAPRAAQIDTLSLHAALPIFGVERLQVERWHGPTRGAVQHHEAARAERVEALVEGGLADRVVDHGKAFATGQLAGLLCEVVVRRDLIGPGRSRDLGLLRCADGSQNLAAA